MKTVPEIFISYAYGDMNAKGKSREEMVAELYYTLSSKGFKVIRDKVRPGQAGEVSEFLKGNGKGKYVVIIVSDKYLKSEYCMSEIQHLMKVKDINERLFPILMADANIFDEINRLEYLDYWSEKRDTLQDRIRYLRELKDATTAQIKLKQFDDIREIIGAFTGMIRSEHSLTPDMHEEKDFDELVELIREKYKEDFAEDMANKPPVKVATPPPAQPVVPPPPVNQPTVNTPPPVQPVAPPPPVNQPTINTPPPVQPVAPPPPVNQPTGNTPPNVKKPNATPPKVSTPGGNTPPPINKPKPPKVKPPTSNTPPKVTKPKVTPPKVNQPKDPQIAICDPTDVPTDTGKTNTPKKSKRPLVIAGVVAGLALLGFLGLNLVNTGNQERPGTVQGIDVSVRSSPYTTKGNNVIGSVSTGDEVTILKQQTVNPDDWAYLLSKRSTFFYGEDYREHQVNLNKNKAVKVIDLSSSRNPDLAVVEVDMGSGKFEVGEVYKSDLKPLGESVWVQIESENINGKGWVHSDFVSEAN